MAWHGIADHLLCGVRKRCVDGGVLCHLCDPHVWMCSSDDFSEQFQTPRKSHVDNVDTGVYEENSHARNKQAFAT